MRIIPRYSLLLLIFLAGLGCSFAGSSSSNLEVAQAENEPIGSLDRVRRIRQAAWRGGESNWANPDSGLRRDTPFGLHAVGMPFLNKIRESNASIIRIIISGEVWKKLEKERGGHHLDFTKLDKVIRGLQKNGIDLVITLDPNSKKWGARHLFSKKKGAVEPTTHSDTPEKMDLYEKTLRQLVERYDNDGIDDMPGLAYSVDYYQIVNEWVWQWKSNKQRYLDHLKLSWEVITTAHPRAKILLGGLTGVEYMAVEEGVDKNRSLKVGGMFGVDRPKIVTIEEFKRKKPGQIEDNIERLKFLLSEGQPYYDIIDLHSYTETYEEMIPSIEIIKMYAPRKEIWSLENGGPYYRYSPARHSEEIVKRYVAGLAHGIKKLFWSSYNPTGGWSKNFLNLSLLDNRGKKKAAYHTFRFLAGNMADFRFVSKVDLEPGVEAYEVTTEEDDLYVIWSHGGKERARLPWAGDMEGVKAVSLHVVSDRRTEIRDVPVAMRDRYLEFEVSETPVFIGRRIKRY